MRPLLNLLKIKKMSIFSKIENTRVGSNTFDLRHDRKFSGKIGRLIPFLVVDTVPGDKFTIKSSAMVRFAPLIAPVMHQVSIFMHYFFVPNRLVWDNWETFITGGEEDDTTQPVWPHFEAYMDELQKGRLGDYLGMPAEEFGAAGDASLFSAIPWAVYATIWAEYYRDQNLQPLGNPNVFKLSDGDNTGMLGTFETLRLRSWQHDYFTSALPWTQKGPAVTLPLGGEAPIYSYAEPGNNLVRDSGGNLQTVGTTLNAANPGLLTTAGGGDLQIDLNDTHYTDLSEATASTIADLRRAFKLQEWLEKNARGGSRYIESIAVHFGVRSSDARLQRPEYLGGFKAPIKISEVLQNAPLTEVDGTETTPQGNMAGHAIGIGGGKRISHYSEEHGYIMGIMSVMPKTAYQQGIPKHFLRRDKFDYYWPSFAHIGEQPIENQELYANGTNGTDTFGYTPRYVEYKHIQSSIHGDFRDTLDFWHMGRKFSSQPALNEDFILCDYNEVDRIFAVQDDSDHLWCHVLNDVKATRKMPYFGNPKF